MPERGALGRFGKVGRAGEEHCRRREQRGKGADIEARAAHLHSSPQFPPTLGAGPFVTWLRCALVLLVCHLADHSSGC